MKKLLIPTLATRAVSAAACTGATNGSAPASPTTAPAPSSDAVDYEDVQAFIEYNAGSEDLGFHAELGAEPCTTCHHHRPQ